MSDEDQSTYQLNPFQVGQVLAHMHHKLAETCRYLCHIIVLLGSSVVVLSDNSLD